MIFQKHIFHHKKCSIISPEKSKNVRVGNKKYDFSNKNYKDILELGMFETSKDHIKIIEWPELIELKPKNRIDILFQYSKLKNSRKVEVVGFGKWKDYKFNEI